MRGGRNKGRQGFAVLLGIILLGLVASTLAVMAAVVGRDLRAAERRETQAQLRCILRAADDGGGAAVPLPAALAGAGYSVRAADGYIEARRGRVALREVGSREAGRWIPRRLIVADGAYTGPTTGP